jgi:Holliday junction resolvase RusA-like endonuclease
MRINFTVHGFPQPKGSTKAFTYRAKDKQTGQPLVGKRGQPVYLAATTAANPKTKGWQSAVATGARLEMARLGLTLVERGSITVEMTFYQPRPKRLKRGEIPPHNVKPDLDKLVRSVFDAMTGVVCRDDAQIVSILAAKGYAAESDGGRGPRVEVAIDVWD